MNSVGGFTKQEYIHLHGLLSKVAEYSDEELELYDSIKDNEKYQEYLEMDVKPTSIHKSKVDHKKSVFLLADSITEFLDGEGQSVQP